MIDSVFKYIVGLVKLRGATDGTLIGNTSDSLKVATTSSALPTGASTLAEQQTQTTSLQLIDDVVNAINTALNKVAAIGGQLDDTSTTAATENNIAPFRITAQRAVHANLRDNSGVEIDPRLPYQGTLTDKSGSATGVSSQVAAANATRKYFYIQCQAGTIWMNFGVAAVASQPSIKLNAGDSFTMEGTFISTQAINVISGGGTRDYTAKEGN
jgi:hypothetical protein